jgi:NitT/TauT family transport system ATP-binding protein
MQVLESATNTTKTGLECQDVSFLRDTDSATQTEILKDISFTIRDGEFVSIIGPSGCGKSTLLNILCGLLNPTKGNVFVEGNPINGPQKEVGMVFQDYGLFPWLTVQQNVEFGMKLKSISKLERNQRTQDILNKVGLLSARHKYPHQLSGGMKQRVAIARVLANDSEYLLMDEPFGALDHQTRLIMQRFLLDVWKQFNKTILFVTHHVEEALILSERVFLMTSRPGMFLEEATIGLRYPRDITTKEFNNYRIHILTHLEREVLKGFKEQDV